MNKTTILLVALTDMLRKWFRLHKCSINVFSSFIGHKNIKAASSDERATSTGRTIHRLSSNPGFFSPVGGTSTILNNNKLQKAGLYWGTHNDKSSHHSPPRSSVRLSDRPQDWRTFRKVLWDKSINICRQKMTNSSKKGPKMPTFVKSLSRPLLFKSHKISLAASRMQCGHILKVWCD